MTSAAPFFRWLPIRRPLIAVGLAAAIFGSPLASSPATAVSITSFTLAVAETAASDPAIAEFYKARDYAPLWTGEGAAARRTALLQALSDADAHGLPTLRYQAEDVIAAFQAARGDTEIGRLEVEITRIFLSYAQDIQSGALEPTAILPDEIKRELPRRDRGATLAGFAAAESPGQFLRALAPGSAHYLRLMREKARLELLIASGGWGATVPATSFDLGDRGEAVILLRNRLIAMGYLGRSASPSYDDALAAGVHAFQAAHGLATDGLAKRGTMEEINRSPEERLKSVIVALERERWMNIEGGLGARHVWVNLPDFHARLVDDGKVTFETRAVVGERRTEKRTFEFSDQMEHMEVNPDWTVPRSIFARDYLPRMQTDPNSSSYLMLIDRRGRVVPREEIDFTLFNEHNFPFTVRQAPGNSNALGRVKFMFPNPHAIYLHDTPQRNLFSREQRDFSSGCIRLNDPLDFAYRLLERQMDDPKPFFDDILHSRKETQVDLDVPIPVHLVYFTAFIDADGEVQYRRDIYGRDAKLFAVLRDAGVAFPGAEG